MKIFIGVPTGYSEPYDVEPSDTIENIRAKIMVKKKIPFEDIELYLPFKQLNDLKTLADYNIKENDSILLVICPKSNKNRRVIDKETLINEKKEIREYLKKIDLQKQLEECKKLTGQIFDQHDIEMAQPNNKIKYEERTENIKEIQTKLLTEKITNNEEYINNITQLGQKMKENIIYETFNNPEKFVKPEDIKNAQPGSVELIEGALSTLLSENNITCAIEKETSNEESAKLTLQLISSGEAFRNNMKICYSYGEEKDALITSNEEEKQKFIKEKKKLYSEILNVPEEDVIISNIEYGSINFWVSLKGQNFTKCYLDKIEKDAKNKGETIDVKLGCLLCGCKISSSMFDSQGNRSSGWGKGEKRGPPNHLIDYDPPEGWYGYGLKVLKVYGDDTWLGYSNVEGEWYIAYHGTSGSFGQAILDGGFKAGDGQVHEGYDNINELSKSKYPKVGIGVYCTPKISIANSYSKTISFGGKNYKFVFMCRVNPYYVRMSSSNNDYWVVSGDYIKDSNAKKYDDQIRPYRMLLKEC